MTSENQVKRLTVDDIEVPEGMMAAAAEVHSYTLRELLAAALLWLAENPIMPSKDEAKVIGKEFWRDKSTGMAPSEWGAIEWQRRMFLRKQAALPVEVKKLLADTDQNGCTITPATAKQRIIAAYKLGKEGK